MSKGARTRMTILQTAFDLIYRNGYQATSIDDILDKLEVTKGSFFYHFSSKDDMGLALIDEVLYPGMKRLMIDPLIKSNDARTELYRMMEGLLMADDLFLVDYGCPAVNMIEEMAPLNPGFKKGLKKLSDGWQRAIETCVEKSITEGNLNKTHHPEEIAVFVISGYGGVRNMGKLQGKQAYTRFLSAFKRYLDSL